MVCRGPLMNWKWGRFLSFFFIPFFFYFIEKKRSRIKKFFTNLHSITVFSFYFYYQPYFTLRNIIQLKEINIKIYILKISYKKKAFLFPNVFFFIVFNNWLKNLLDIPFELLAWVWRSVFFSSPRNNHVFILSFT